jgi:hypothetical protein
VIPRAFHSAVLLATCAFSASGARAAPGDATRLEYARSDRAAACPDRAALKAAVSKRLGYDPFFPAARQTIVVEIVDVEGGLRAQMRLVDENGMIVGSRELREKAENCDELVASLALAISIALDPSAALGEASASALNPDSAASKAAEASPESARESAAQEHPQKTSRGPIPQSTASLGDVDPIQLAIRASGFTDVGTAPAIAFGWRLGLDLGRKRYRLGAEFTQQLPASKELAEGGSARASLLAGTLAPCFVSDTLAGCGVLTLGALQTRGENIPYPSSQSTFYAALGARFEFTPRLSGNLQLLTQIDGLKPLTPVSLHVAGTEVWHTPFFTFSLAVGLRLRFQ